MDNCTLLFLDAQIAEIYGSHYHRRTMDRQRTLYIRKCYICNRNMIQNAMYSNHSDRCHSPVSPSWTVIRHDGVLPFPSHSIVLPTMIITREHHYPSTPIAGRSHVHLSPLLISVCQDRSKHPSFKRTFSLACRHQLFILNNTFTIEFTLF